MCTFERMIECAIDDCNTKKFSRGLCQRHYNQWYTGKLDYTPPVKPTECSIQGCARAPKCLGYCDLHYSRHRAGTPMDQPLEVHEAGRICEIEGCYEPHVAKGLCMTHWARQKRGADVNAPIYTRLGNVDSLTRLRTYAPVGQPDECWEWTRGKTKGYGTIRTDDSRMRNAHVVAWELHTGEALPTGMIVRHTCDNPPCTNPAHLLLGTHADNMRDKSERGRWGAGGRTFRHRTPEEVQEIRDACARPDRNYAAISRQYGCSRATVMRIANGEVFKNA